MFRFEWKKLMLYRKGLVLILLFLLAEMAGICLSTKAYDKELEANRAVYDSYLSQVEGPLTPEKREWLENEMLRLNTANIKLEQLKSDYYSGNVAEEEYWERFDALAAENADYPGFSKLYTQYIFVRESDQRSFLYTGGWEVLFGDQEPDYLFLLLLIFLLTPIFCQEYGNQMDQLLLTQRRSAKYLWQTKLALALLLTAALTAMLQLFELCYCALRFGLPHWDYSLQSLYSFGTVQKQLKLWQAFALQFALKELGYLYAALLLLCISVLVKKYAFALMAGLVILPIPFLTVNSNTAFLHLPGPWAFTIGSIYLNGDKAVQYGSVAAEVAWGELGQVVTLTGVICLVLLLCIRHKNTNYHVRDKRAKSLAAMLAVLLLCSGCGGKEKLYYNANTANCFETDRYIVFAADLEGSFLIDKQTDTVYGFPMDAFQGETAKVNNAFYYEAGKLYYLKSEQQYPNSNSESAMDEYALVSLDLGTMEETTVYRWNQSSDWFFGLLDRESMEPYPGFINTFFLHDGGLYYVQNSELYVMDLQNGRHELYAELTGGSSLAYDGTNIYYSDRYNRLVVHNLDTGRAEAMEKVVARKFVLTPEGIYFLNAQDGNTLYYWNEATQTAEKLDNTDAYELYWDENYCWVDSLDGLYRINHDGSNKTKVDCPGLVICISTGSAMYTKDYESETIYAVNKQTLKWEALFH